jgi:hypothetical protein
MERRIREVKQETIGAFYPNLNLAAFYRKVAEEFQMLVEEGYGFDCRKIRIASNIQKQWCEKFEKEHGEAQRWEINMRLCMSGPCVEKYLRENEVEVEEDWICKIE